MIKPATLVDCIDAMPSPAHLPKWIDALDYMTARGLTVHSHAPGYVVFSNGRPCGWELAPCAADKLPGHYIIVDLLFGGQFECQADEACPGGARWKQLSRES